MSETFDIASAARQLTPGRPLVVVDADEVLLMFVDGFDRFLRAQGLYLDLNTYRLHGNVKRESDNVALLDVDVTALLEEFRRTLASLAAVEGAQEALLSASTAADIVVLSNIRPDQAPARRRNLDTLGLPYPLVCNEGPKGEAVYALCARAGRPVFFVDDIPAHLASAAKAVGDIHLIHMVGDERLKPLLPAFTGTHLRAKDWHQAADHMRKLLQVPD